MKRFIILAALLPSVLMAQDSTVAKIRPITIQHIRPMDARGINVFESPKNDTVTYKGFNLEFGGAFTQQFQALDHSNTASPKLVNGVDANKLIQLGHGFNNAVANSYLNVQLAPGIRLAMTSFLSSRHHNETWVKDGYVLVDELPIALPLVGDLVKKYVTIKAGHFEVNYGDTHFRRTDNGNSMFNPLVGNYIMDAFTTSIGTEVYVRPGDLILMAGITNGEVRGTVLNPQKRSAAYLAKVGFDHSFAPKTRVRMTVSSFAQAKAANQTLYSGDRAGSRYYDVLENTTSTEAAQAWSGAIQPSLNELHAVVFNPFVSFHGLELYGNIERARGKNATETVRRQWNQNAIEGTYRLLGDKLYATARYNTAKGKLPGFTEDATVVRTQVGGGFFITKNILTKVEYVRQQDKDFPLLDIRHGGKFQGLVAEGSIAF